MKSVESLCNHRHFVKQTTAYRDAIAGEKLSFPPLPLPSRIEEIPAPVAHMPPTGKRPKKMPIMTIGLPTGKKDKGKKKVVSSSIVASSGDEALNWRSDNGLFYDALDEDIAESAGLEWKRPLTPNAFYDADNGRDIGGGTNYDHITPQVPFHSIGMIGSLMVEKQGQFCDGLVDSLPTCICNNLIANISLSDANCTNCKKSKSNDPIGVTKDLVRRFLLKKGEIEFIGDSGASATFTNDLNDFSEYKDFVETHEAHTANKGVPLKIKGSGTVFLEHQVDVSGSMVHVWLSPVLLYIFPTSTGDYYLWESGCNKVAHWWGQSIS